MISHFNNPFNQNVQILICCSSRSATVTQSLSRNVVLRGQIDVCEHYRCTLCVHV